MAEDNIQDEKIINSRRLMEENKSQDNLIVIEIPTPKIVSKKIEIHFTSSENLPQFKQNSFWFEYPTVDAKYLTKEVGWHIALNVIVAKLGELKDNSIIKCEEEIPESLLRFLQIYNNAFHVDIQPIKKENNHDLFFKKRNDLEHRELSKKPGLLFGGGKDSLASLGLLLETGTNVGLISYSFSYIGQVIQNEKRREENSAIKYAKEKGINVDIIRTNIVHLLAKSPLHFELYTSSVLPVLNARDYGNLLFCVEMCHYYTSTNGQVNKIPRFRRSRPEINRLISSHYKSNLGVNCNVLNLHLPISEYGTYLLLTKRYSELLPNLLMCEGSTDSKIKWCGNCTKCAEHVIFSLASNTKSEINPDDFFKNSPWILNKILPKLKEYETKKLGWFEGLTFIGHLDSFRHVLSKIDYSKVEEKEARSNLRLLIEKLAFPLINEEKICTPMISPLNHPSTKPFFDIMIEELGSCEHLYSKHWGNETTEFDPEFDVLAIEEALRPQYTKN